MIFLHCSSWKIGRSGFLEGEQKHPSEITHLTDVPWLKQKTNKNRKSMGTVTVARRGIEFTFFDRQNSLPLEYILDPLDEQPFEFLGHLHLRSDRK